MENTPIVVEQILSASADKVWKAITDKTEMKKWYFDLKEFKPEPGFEFQFYGGTEEKQYLHLCKIIEADPDTKLMYSWRYDRFVGESFVTFELFNEGDKTKFLLTHEGLETFPQDIPNFKKENFAIGWNDIIGRSLPEYLKTQ